jgi:3-phosphoshikimate 1-carboxyvinyltransferase
VSLTVHPGTVDGTVQAPGSKSITHRGLFLALACQGGTVEAPLISADTRASHDAIRAFGAKTLATTDEIVVRGATVTPGQIDARNSGTTLRIATAFAALADGTTTLTGDDSLQRRPIGPLVDALEQLGAEATYHDTPGQPPLDVTGPITGGKATIDASESSQYVTALMLAAPLMPDGLELAIDGDIASKPYVDLTVDLLEAHDVPVEETDHGYRVAGPAPGRAHVTVPGGYSAAAFPLTAGATAGQVTVENLPTDTGQGDEAITQLLGRFGADPHRDGDAIQIAKTALEAAEIDLNANPDLFPPLAVLAANSEGTTRLTGAEHLRDKESDRIQAIVDGLTELGIEVDALDDGAEITGGTITGGTVQARDDHRIQMAFAIAALSASKPVTITGPSDVHEVSYPTFVEDLRSLGAEITTEEGST